MKRVLIIAEGPTEKAFCDNVLQQYMNSKDVSLYTSIIRKSEGGIVHWSSIKKQVENYLKEDRNVHVTTMIDFYGILDKHQFPGWKEAKTINDKYERIEFIGRSMSEDIDESYRNRFLPYIQLHEFEGLLFSDLSVFKEIYEEEDFLNYDYLEKTCKDFENPEMINENKNTAPSSRLKNEIFKSYHKTIDGPYIAYTIGIEKIRSKCYGFDKWIYRLEKIAMSNL